MIEPLRRSQVVPVPGPLPACWLRVRPTEPDRESANGRILRAGPRATLHQAILRTIGDAQEVVLAASFLLADATIADALIEATKRGVRVYVLTASENRVATAVREDDAFEARMVEEHKRLLDRLAGNVLLRSAEHFHAKFLIADPGVRAHGWLSTANFNPALRESVELGVELTPGAAAELASWFSWAFWKEAERELVEKGRLAKVGPPPAEPTPPGAREVVATTGQHRSLKEAALRLISGARSTLFMASYGIAADHDVTQAALEKARAGVRVTVLTRPRPAVVEAATAFAAAGARVLAHDKLHAKAILGDGGGLVMTANIERQGLDHGFEVGVLLSAADAAALREVLEDWCERFPWRFDPAPDRTKHVGEICLASSGLRDGRRSVEEEARVTLPQVIAKDALRLDEADPPPVPTPESSQLAHRVRYEWEVVPPRLPRGAKERLREVEREEKGKDGKPKKVKERAAHDPPVFDHNGDVLVVLREADGPDRVAKVAAELGARVVLP